MEVSRQDVGAAAVFLVIGGALLSAMAPTPNGPSPLTFSNLRTIGQGIAAYREDHAGYYPIVLTYSRGSTQQLGVSLEGWCTWQFGGKNNNGFWGFRVFDVEAADRPLNPYVVPDEFFAAPPFPTRMPASYPARATAQAPMFHDPGDLATHQRNWPSATSGISAYDDVGTSYHTNMDWWNSISGTFMARFAEGTRRLAVGEGVDPSRFVVVSDEFSAIITNTSNLRLQVVNGYGDRNFVPLLFVDGHATYERLSPAVRTTARYTFTFEP
ncbi:MAG: hypothetical protein AB7G11_01215 [Phycisphaerales bacterium]